jgi:citrate lyase subunit beta/citryl-CoA lyase
MSVRPRRSVLYMPGSNVRALEKARELPVDGVILDLEDAVAPEAKGTARDLIKKTLQKGGFGDREVLVRINGLDTRWWVDDLHLVADCRPDAVLVPKISDPHQLQALAARIVDMGTDPHIRVWAMMETPLAMLNVAAIAAAAHDSETRLSGFVMGTNDLAKDTRARIVPGREPMLPWLSNCVAAARAFGLDILDGVYNDLGDAEGFAAECRQARDLGFDGKTLIHPAQIEACNEAFSPAPEEVAAARKIIAAFDLPENAGKGVIQIEGRMVERLHADMARCTVDIADAIARRQPPVEEPLPARVANS